MNNKVFDIYNIDKGEFFKQNRVVYIYGEITSLMAYEVCGRLKYLDYLDSEKDIILEINSPGGEVYSGLAIIDTINCIKAHVKVVVSGMAASMAALITACCSKGKRYALPHSMIMIHQPLGGTGLAQASDIAIYANNISKTKRMLNELLAKATGQSVKTIAKDTDRDYYLNAEEAIKYGIIDKIVDSRKE